MLQSVVEAPEKESSGGGGGGGVASTAKHGRWNETSSQQHQQQHLVLLSLDGSKKVKPTSAEALPAKSPSYLPSATARRAEQMLSSLGESIEMTSTDVKIFQEKGDDEKVNRKRKLNPEHDLDEVSNALADVADEFARMLEGQSSRPCYPLSTMFGLDVIGSPNKMVRLQFVARDGSNDDSSASTSPTTSTTTMMMTSKNSDDSGRRVDIDAITSLAFDGPVQSSKLEMERNNEIGDERFEQNDVETSCVGGREKEASHFGRKSKSRRCGRRHCRHCCKKEKRRWRTRRKSGKRHFAETETCKVKIIPSSK